MALALALALAALALATLLASPAWAAAFTVNSTADDVDASAGNGICATVANECTLRAAIQESNALTGPDEIDFSVDTVTLSVNGAGESSGATGDLDIAQEAAQDLDLTINGGGVVISAVSGFDDRAFEILASANATISNVTVQGFSNTNLSNGPGGGVLVNPTATLSLRDSTLKSNKGNSGGGVASAGTLEITGSTFTDNTSDGFFSGFAVGGDGGGAAGRGRLDRDGER